MNLVIDIGNTSTKLAIFEGPVMRDFIRLQGFDVQRISLFLGNQPLVRQAIISSVKDLPEGLHELLKGVQVIMFSSSTPLPLKILYKTPETLGPDRLAGIVAASAMYPGNDVLVIDAGTAITYDLYLNEKGYMGGGIAPGIRMRYQALHTFTGRLPLLEEAFEAELVGDSTAGSIHSGVLNGVLAEVDGIIERYRSLFPSIRFILTGGDYLFFDKQLKIKTFAAPNLILEGLGIILSYNTNSTKRK